jgi:hypothetical protein
MRCRGADKCKLSMSERLAERFAFAPTFGFCSRFTATQIIV